MPNLSQKSQDIPSLKGKKILLIVTQTKWGGAQKYVLELAQYLIGNNEVHLAYGEINDVNKKFIEECQNLKLTLWPLKNLVRSINLGSDTLAIMEISKLYAQHKYDLVHLNSSKAGLLGSLAAFFYQLNPTNARLRVFYTAHGFVFNEPGPKIQKWLFKTSEMVSTGFQHYVIAVSDFDRQSALDNKILPAYKIVTIHNGIEPNQYNFLDQIQARQELGLEPNKKYFGTIASFYQTKGYQYLVDTIKILKEKNSDLINNHQWIFIGEGPQLASIKKQISASNLDQYIKIIAPQDNDWKYLKAFDFFVLPSVKEGLPYTILEAGLAQVPLISTRVGGIPEIINDGENGYLVAAADPISLAMTMEKMTKNAEVSLQMAEKNYNNILQNFSLKNTLQETEKLYLRTFKQ